MLFSTLCRTKQQLSQFHLGAFLCGLAVAGAACLFFAGDFNNELNANSISVADPVNISVGEKPVNDMTAPKKEFKGPSKLIFDISLLAGAMLACFAVWGWCLTGASKTTMALTGLSIMSMLAIYIYIF